MSTSGIINARHDAATAATVDAASRAPTGRTYGHSRNSDRTVDRRAPGPVPSSLSVPSTARD
ncbi:protein of unknown function [Streptantibioticus cattleyicolor NRRL 8057 = DSM 46488]|nr:protein of unknown function [Streptantibioticus cattleyicolor NRRL 8057 = DSM 46488]